MSQELNRLINLLIIVGGSYLAFKAQTDPRYAWAIPALQAIATELPSVNLTGLIKTPAEKPDK